MSGSAEFASFINSLIVAISVGLAASFLGVFIILRRMALVGDALSHVAIPGMALAILFNLNPFIGAISFLIFAVIVIVLIDRQGILTTETLVGIFFTTALAIGALLLPDPELLEKALFGDIVKISRSDVILAILFSIATVSALLYNFQKFSTLILSKEISHSEGVRVERTEFIFLLLFALAVAIGIKIMGALLIGALVIIPASTAKNISSNFKQMIFITLLLGVFSMTTGVWIAYLYKTPPGPMVAVINSVFFAFSLIGVKLKTS